MNSRYLRGKIVYLHTLFPAVHSPFHLHDSGNGASHQLPQEVILHSNRPTLHEGMLPDIQPKLAFAQYQAFTPNTMSFSCPKNSSLSLFFKHCRQFT